MNWLESFDTSVGCLSRYAGSARPDLRSSYVVCSWKESLVVRLVSNSCG